MNRNLSYYAEILQGHLPELQKQFSIKWLQSFVCVSYVRGQQRAGISDLDVLVNFNELPDPSLDLLASKIA